MDDGELWQYYSVACLVWARANGDSDATLRSFELRDVGGVISISSWGSSAPQPTDSDLRAIGVPACLERIAEEVLLMYMTPDYTVVSATQLQIDAIVDPPEGAIVINLDLSLFQVYISGEWVSVTPPDRVLYPVELVEDASKTPMLPAAPIMPARYDANLAAAAAAPVNSATPAPRAAPTLQRIPALVR